MTTVTGVPVGIVFWDAMPSGRRVVGLTFLVGNVVRTATANIGSETHATSMQGAEMIAMIQAAIHEKWPITITVGGGGGSPPDATYPVPSVHMLGLEIQSFKWGQSYLSIN
jgi:hypothetical protein